MSFAVLSSYDIKTALMGAGVRDGAIVFKDQQYCLPAPEWITGPFSKSETKFYFDTGIEYEEDVYECNAFSLTALADAKRCFAKTPKSQRPQASLAMGTFTFFLKEMTEHDIIVAIHKNEQGKLYPAFYEPQAGVEEGKSAFQKICLTPMQLSPGEVQSCLACWFW